MRRVPFVLLALVLASGGAASAAETGFEASFRQDLTYQTNPNLLAQGARTLRRSSSTPSFSFSGKTPTSHFKTVASVTQNIANLSGYGTTDAAAHLSAGRETQNWDAGLDFNGAYDTTQESELTTLGLNTKAERRKAASLTPTLAYKPSARTRLALTPMAEKVLYEDKNSIDYHIFQTALEAARSLTPTQTGFVSASLRRYQADEGAKRRVDSVSPSVGWRAALTPEASVQASLGAQSSQDRIFGFKDSWRWSWVGDLAVTFKNERHDLTFGFSRQQQPYLNGDETLLTGVRFDERFQLTELVRLTLSGAFYRGEQGENSRGSLRQKEQIGPGFALRLAPSLDLTGDYRYRSEKLYNRQGRAQDHRALLGFVYKP